MRDLTFLAEFRDKYGWPQLQLGVYNNILGLTLFLIFLIVGVGAVGLRSFSPTWLIQICCQR